MTHRSLVHRLILVLVPAPDRLARMLLVDLGTILLSIVQPMMTHDCSVEVSKTRVNS